MRTSSPNSTSKKVLTSPRSASAVAAAMEAAATPASGDPFPPEAWLDDASVQDMDHFVKALGSIRAKGARPDLLGSIIAHYAPKWLPELSANPSHDVPAATPSPSPSPVAAWAKKKFVVETLVRVLPPEKDAVGCGFVLRLLRAACMVGAAAECVAEVEARAARLLDQATLREIMIPAFSHTCGTLLDVGLVLRLVRGFSGLDEAARSGSAMVKVAKLVDSYLAEAALDAGLTVEQFKELARALPAHARATDDGLYRAIDTYIQAHPSTTKEQKKALCRLIDPRKLSPEASLHAAQNERLPVRAVLQVLFSENSKLNRVTEWSTGSFSGPRSPSTAAALDLSGRVPSKREVMAQQQEIRRLREDVARLQMQCQNLQTMVDKLMEKTKKKGFFRWSSFLFRGTEVAYKYEFDESTTEHRTPVAVKKLRHDARNTPKWRNSLS